MLKIAVIGLGNIGNTHAPIYKASDKAELVAVCDIIEERADAAAAKYSVPAYYSVDDLLAAVKSDTVELDAVSVCSAGVENGGDHGIHANVCVYLDRYSTTPSKVYCSDDYPLPEGRSNLAQEVFHHLETGEPVHYTMDLNNNLWSAAMLDAGIRSSRSLKMEEVKTACWTIG